MVAAMQDMDQRRAAATCLLVYPTPMGWVGGLEADVAPFAGWADVEGGGAEACVLLYSLCMVM